jgi:hypothetical protein
MRISNTVSVNRPVSEVFARVCDLRFLAEVDRDIESIEKLTPGPIEVGTVFRELLRPPGLRVIADLEITRIDPDQSLQFRFQSVQMKGTGSITCEPDSAGATLTIRVEAQMRGMWKLLYPMVRIEFPWRERMRLRNTKTLIERESAAPEPTAVAV